MPNVPVWVRLSVFRQLLNLRGDVGWVLSFQWTGCFWPGVGLAHGTLYHVSGRSPEGDLWT